MTAPSSAVLAGVRVVEFAENAAVPQCGRLLAGMGAEVVKVEHPRGDAMRGLAGLGRNEARAYAAINPGKRAICLDLSAPGAREVVDALIDWADVALVGLKQDALDGYGLAWEQVHARNPALVLLALTAFGPDGPDADQGGYDVLVQGMSGLGFVMNRSEEGTPLPTRPALIDFATGSMAALGVVAALRARDLTGVGQRVDASLLGTAMALGTPMLVRFDVDDEGLDAVAEDLALLRDAGVDFDAQREFYESRVVAGAGVFHLYFRHYLTADGIISVAGMSGPLISRFHEITGLPRPAIADPHTPEFRSVVRDAEELFASRSSEEWLQTLREAGYPATRYNAPFEAVDDPQVRANDYVVELEHPVFGGYRTVGMPFRFSDSPVGVVEPSPRLGAHTAEVLGEIGITPERVAEMERDRIVRGADHE